MIANTPSPPYYAVVFVAVKNKIKEAKEYTTMAKRMRFLAEKEAGFLGFENAENSSGEISISYWKDIESINNWKQNIEHKQAQLLGKEKWYANFSVRIAKVEKDYSFTNS